MKLHKNCEKEAWYAIEGVDYKIDATLVDHIHKLPVAKATQPGEEKMKGQAEMAKTNGRAVATDNVNGVKDGLAASGLKTASAVVSRAMVEAGLPSKFAESELGELAIQQVVTPMVLRQVGSTLGESTGDKMHRLAAHGARGGAAIATAEKLAPLINELCSVIKGLPSEVFEE